MNDALPPDINILRVEEAHPRFDARRDAVSRYYLYQISTRRSAFAKRFVWWVKDTLDVAAMQRAAERLVGMHDFARFADKRADEGSTLVSVQSVEIGLDGDLILFRIGASHYLWKMVRRIAGVLVEVGRGKISPDEFAALFQKPEKVISKDGMRQGSDLNVAAFTAPPSGLFLELVTYDEKQKAGDLKPAFPV